MKKSKKIILTILPVLMILAAMFVTFTPAVFAEGEVSTDFPDLGTSINTVENLGKNVWATVIFVARILAFAAIIFAGVRYMFASADQKADIKKSMIYLVIGAVLVFASTFLVDTIVDVTDQLNVDESGKTNAINVVTVRNIDEIA